MISPAGIHGGDVEAVARSLGVPPDSLLDLSASLNPAAPNPGPLLARHLPAIVRYPDPTRATAALADALGVDGSRLLLTNGGAEAIALVARLHPAGWVEDPEFSLYRRHLTEIRPGGPRWRSNPRNPTGLLADPSEHASVWDEAFYPLATGAWTRGDRDAIVVGSLTKLLRCPGLRIGYLLVPDGDDVERFAALQPRWSLNGLAAAALPDMLEQVDLPAWAAEVSRLRLQLHELLLRHGLMPLPSDSNWLLVRGEPRLRELLAPHGVLVRDCSSFDLPGVARIAVPDADGLERLDRALACALWENRR
ncbi:Histidinol-phosphate/aromatic aminotransferase/cobyric acid decarboxylase [Gaiella occulta]|uniref:histidinol-phosphate transaminase n=1 Tax=Gaiella occulta TaxID=1002870 RepID=A0A7M2YVG6_9ACTN|nr:aminotransferase class I/II-fold pyridoxal phosphate-dependent enzyme [Gaiella occulta]RDI73579.1 Histidinol-phosphate/aromatic aminotransferase/cobyric acid decarboxylase [Gaiella occulta]